MGAFSDFTIYANETGARLSDEPLVFETTRHLDATQHDLFEYISDFDRLSEWIFGAKKSWADDTNAEKPGEAGSVRVIQPLAGPEVRETVKAFEAPRMLAYSAADETFKGLCTSHLSVLTCEPHPNGGTVVCWQSYGRLPSSRAKAWLGKKLFQVALSSSMKKLEHKLSTR
jgi:uncharacterized protein YndB with AHSA1/START domain